MILLYCAVLFVSWVSGFIPAEGNITAFPPTLPRNRLSLRWHTTMSHPTVQDLVDISRREVKKQYNLNTVMKDAYTTAHNNVTHIYLRPVVRGLEVFNGDLNLNVVNGEFISGYLPEFNISDTNVTAQHTPETAVIIFAEYLGLFVDTTELFNRTTANTTEGQFHNEVRGYPWVFPQSNVSLDEIPVKLGWVAREGYPLTLCYSVIVRTDDAWYDAWVIAHRTAEPSVLAVNDWSSSAGYMAYEIGTNDPSFGQRVFIVNPHVRSNQGSPLGWHNEGPVAFPDTRGNNVWAQENWSGSTNNWQNNSRPNGGVNQEFNFVLDLSRDPKEPTNWQAAVTNLFVWCNYFHDLTYNYGFTEVAGNFQWNNFGRGGKQDDSVYAHAQDGSGTNNANFMTPPDGLRGRMRMYVWTRSSPYRDGDLDAGIIVHEYHHGLSNRMVGGPDNANCMQNFQAGGIGEGGGDYMATMFSVTSSSNRWTPFHMGAWSNNGNGIRRVPYTCDTTLNPWTFQEANNNQQVHSSGTVWVTLNWEVFWDLVETRGFCGGVDWWRPELGCGNHVALLNYIDAYALAPCGLNFLQMRDAMLLADHFNYGDRHRCLYWRAFARRGMGVSATLTGSGWGVATNGFDVPSDC